MKEWQKTLDTIIDKNNIEDIIDIYRNRLFVIHVNYDYSLKDYESREYLDLFHSMSDSIYNDIYRYNKLSNCYLGDYLTNTNNTIKLRVIDLYYYLIGYT